MVYGYLRVSTNNQDLANQESAILAYANDRGLGRVASVYLTIRKANEGFSMTMMTFRSNPRSTIQLY